MRISDQEDNGKSLKVTILYPMKDTIISFMKTGMKRYKLIPVKNEIIDNYPKVLQTKNLKSSQNFSLWQRDSSEKSYFSQNI